MGGQRRALHPLVAEARRQEHQQVLPVRAAEHAGQALERFLDPHHRRRLQGQDLVAGPEAVLDIALQQLVQADAKAAFASHPQPLRLAAGKALVAEPRPFEQLLRGAADRVQPPQAPGQRLGQLLAARLAVTRRLRQQQPRLQVGEPGRGDQVVGGDLELEVARLLDIGEVLLRQRQDRDLRQIDLLLPGERQQEVDRPLEAFEVDDEAGRRRLARGLAGSRRPPWLRRTRRGRGPDGRPTRPAAAARRRSG